MNINEARSKLADHGIFQLRKGETLKDALGSIANGTSRKGYKIKHDSGMPMSENQIIAESNKEAFAKTGASTPPDYNEFDIDDFYDNEDFEGVEDYREDKTVIGELQPCQYCGEALHVDKGAEFEIPNCNSCMSHAIWCNCM